MMANKVDFRGPSLQDFEMQDKIETKFTVETAPQVPIAEKSNAPLNNNRSTRSPENLLAANRKAIREYLDNALDNNESTVIRLADISETLHINMNTLYRHLKVLRETDFILKKIFNGTEVRRR